MSLTMLCSEFCADRLGWKRFLFFPTGVTYLRERSSEETTLPTLDEIAEEVEKQLIEYCAGRLEVNLNGFTRDGKGFKFPDYLLRFLPNSTVVRNYRDWLLQDPT